LFSESAINGIRMVRILSKKHEKSPLPRLVARLFSFQEHFYLGTMWYWIWRRNRIWSNGRSCYSFIK